MSAPSQERLIPVSGLLPEGVFPVANLIPDSVAGDRRLQRTKRIALAAVALAVIVVGVLWVLLASQASDAQQQLTQAQTTGAQLKAQQAKYAEIPKVAAQVAAAEANLTTAMAGEVAWSTLMKQLVATAPGGVVIEKVSGAMPANDPATAKAAQATDPLDYGSVTVSGNAATFPTVSAWLKSLVKIPGVSAATLNRSVRVDANDPASRVTFEATLTLNEQALVAQPAAKASGS